MHKHASPQINNLSLLFGFSERTDKSIGFIADALNQNIDKFTNLTGHFIFDIYFNRL